MDLICGDRKLDGDGLALVMALLLGGCYIQSVKAELHPLVNKLWILTSFLLLPYVMVYIVEYLAGQSASLLNSNIFALNYFWCLAVYAVLFVLTNHYRGSVIAGSVFCYVVGVVNYFVLLFRSSPLQLTDVMSIGTARRCGRQLCLALTGICLLPAVLYSWRCALLALPNLVKSCQTMVSVCGNSCPAGSDDGIGQPVL